MKLLLVICLGLFGACAAAPSTQMHFNPFLEIPKSLECGDEDDRGMGNAVRVMFEMLPLTEMIDHFFDAVITDPDVNAFFNYLTGPEFAQISEAVRDMPEFIVFMEYLCTELKFDFYMYLNALGEILNIPPVTRPPGAKQIRSASYNQGGVKILIDELKAMIPSAEIRAEWNRLIETDPYLCQGFRKLSSPEFKTIALKVEFHPEFIRFTQKLREQGVFIDDAIATLKRFLWETPICGL